MRQRLELKDYAGQYCDAIISTRMDGTASVMLTVRIGYGYPILERDQLLDLLQRLDAMTQTAVKA